MKEKTQANKLFINSRWLFITKNLFESLDERLMVTKLKQMVEKCKNNDDKYFYIVVTGLDLVAFIILL
jgi:hypothetical protein